MFSIPPDVLAKIAAGAYSNALALLFDLPEGLFGFWNGYGTLTINSVPYVGAGSLIEVSQFSLGTDLSASPITVRLRAVPEGGLTPDVLATIDTYAYKNRPAHLNLVYFDPITGTVVTALQWWQGYIDLIDHDQEVGGEYTLLAHLEPMSLDHSRTGYRMRSDTDQKLIDPADRFFEHAAVTGTQQVPYGRRPDGTMTEAGRVKK